ncbi:MAG: alpha/beta hydrolase [Solirubrobacteraceae bacterium]
MAARDIVKTLDVAQALAARGLGSLPGGAQRALSGRRRIELDGQLLDPGIQLLLSAMARRGAAEVVKDTASEPPVERARISREARSLARWPTAVGEVRELEVPGAAGPLAARHYAPPAFADGDPALLVYVHGGGWVLGDLDSHDEPCRMLCRHAGINVLSVAYRLAPEHPFPAGVDDAVAVLRWALGAAESLGADPARVAVGGDSAGGNLSAVACQQLALTVASPPPALQVLVYPSTDLAGSTRSSELFADGFFLTARSRRWCETRYAGPEVDRTDPRISPLRAADLTSLPPAIVITAGFDPLRDEGEAYADALREAGVPVVSYRASDLIHGFVNFTTVNRRSRDVTVMLAGMIRAALTPR